MKRTQVYLTDTQHRKLELTAKSLGLTMAVLVRQGVHIPAKPAHHEVMYFTAFRQFRIM